jgi:hypothetical protein
MKTICNLGLGSGKVKADSSWLVVCMTDMTPDCGSSDLLLWEPMQCLNIVRTQ